MDSKGLNELIDSVDSIIYDVMNLTEDEWRKKLLELVYKLQAYLPAESNSYILNYTIGYVYFNMPGNLEEDFQKAEYYLLKSIKFNSKHYFAYNYLGALYYEFKMYSKSLSVLDNIPYGYFNEHKFHQFWRDLKVIEMKLCCKIKLGNDYDEYLNDWISAYSQMKSVDAPLPLEIVDILMSMNNFEHLSHVAEKVLILIAKLDFWDCFEKELPKLKMIACSEMKG